MKKYLLTLILISILALGFITGYAQESGGNKHWINTWTEVEDLGKSKFGATIHVGHQVFKDKIDGQYKKHKLTDERPAKDYILIQGAKCCVEIYPYYAKYFDVNHEEVRLYEERWVIQRLFKAPDKWKDVGAWNPVMVIEEYPEPAGDVVKITVIYDTDYGELIVEYFQRDGNALKHNVIFKNTSGSTETFRVLQRWSGIVGSKCNGKDIPVIEDVPYLAFHSSDKTKKKFNIAENLYSMVFNEDGSEKTDHCLQRPINIETHAQGMKADFIYGNWILAQDESLEIDPATAILDDPTDDGFITDSFGRTDDSLYLDVQYYVKFRTYIEWNISSIPDEATITDTIFKYHGYDHGVDCHIHEMLEARPSTAGNEAVYNEAGEGTVYADPIGFPVVGTGQEQDLGTDADTDLQNQLSIDWFAIGIQADTEDGSMPRSRIYSKDKTDAADPKPTLYVEYSVPPEVNVIFFSTPY